MSEDYTYPPTPRMVRADELDAMQARAEAAERERDAWQRNAAMWHDKADAAEAALAAVPVEAIRRAWQQEYEDRYEDGRLYDAQSQWADDSDVVAEWLHSATDALEARDWQRQNDPREVRP